MKQKQSILTILLFLTTWCAISVLHAAEPQPRTYYGQQVDYRKYQRRHNGGWVNMAIGLEGAYGDKNAWLAGAAVGMRIGNYRDVVQFEIGLAPGLRPKHTFHLPVYSSLKISRKSGKLYLKLGGSYNRLIKHNEDEGTWSGRIGLGTAWKHFDWDWLFLNIESTDGNRSWLSSRSPLTFGMRMALYITQ